ncbi:hypothetical protein F4604DRAFT_1207305 [Suillus subluteus]|nr:hypothetical protein F4604DRAFT_1207305 [Suillus subluteus]
MVPQLLIFGRTLPSPTATSPTIHITPITPATRSPRPDDPTPRKPPQYLLTCTQSIRELVANTRITIKGDDSRVMRRARGVILHLANPKLRGRGKDEERPSTFFRAPALSADKTNNTPDVYVFGPVSDVKGRVCAVDERIGDIKHENKSVSPTLIHVVLLRLHLTRRIPQIINKCTVRHLDAVGMSRTHPEFKELFGSVCWRRHSLLCVNTLRGHVLILSVSESHNKESFRWCESSRDACSNTH